jgi:integrase
VSFNAAKGLYVGQLELGVDASGRRQRKFVYGKDEDTVLDKLDEAAARKKQGLPQPDEAISTRQWLTTWATDVLPRSVKPGTVTNYRDILHAYVLPYIGKVPLAKLTPEHVERMMTELEDEGLSPRTVALARTVLRRALAVAERRGKVPRNVAALTEPPAKSSTKLDDALDADEAEAVLTAAQGDRLAALAVLVLATGLRQGEALSLHWPDINLTAGTLRVTESKTPSGIRTLALPGFVVDALKAHRQRQREERMASDVWGDPGQVFTTTVGTQLDRRNVLRWWHGLTERAGVGRRRFHASRHTAATLMLNGGVPLEVVSATLGHASLAITSDVYARVGAELQRTAADAMEKVLG